MAETLNWVSGSKSIVVEAAQCVSMFDHEWVTFLAQLEALHSALPLKSIEYTLDSPNVYKYKLKTLDNRNWRQTVTFDNQTDPLMSFDVVDGFRPSETRKHREARDAIISFTKKFGATKIECKW